MKEDSRGIWRGVTPDQIQELFQQIKTGKLRGFHIDSLLKGYDPFDELSGEAFTRAGYPQGFSIKPPAEQLAILAEHFPTFDGSHVVDLAQGELPEGAEAWAVVPKPSRVAGDYPVALTKALELLAQARPFKISLYDDDPLQWVEPTHSAMTTMERELPGDYMVFPFQFGLLHRGRSVERARDYFNEGEFDLDPFSTAVLLLTHPGRITGFDNNVLNIKCAGCESHHRIARSHYQHRCRYFFWPYESESLFMSEPWVQSYGPNSGSVTGFLKPQGSLKNK